MELNALQNILNTVSTAMKTPVMVVLVIFLAAAVFSVGWVITEAFTERRHMNYSLPALLDEMKHTEGSLEDCIKSSGLLQRQKDSLLELTKHPDFNKTMLTSLADNMLEREEAHYDSILKMTNLLAKLSPMVGLLGTLIPLGPGIIAISNGDTVTLSESMLTAFDTTVAGLLAAAVALVVHTIRKRWYSAYMSDLETLVDCLVEMETENE